jgi:dihydrofolate reductase
MRKIVLAMNTTLNGRLDDPFAWFADMSDDLYTEIDRAYTTFDTILVGRVTYDEMVEYWPGAETEAGGNEINKRMARKMNTYKKYVFSAAPSRARLAWNNAELVTASSDEDLAVFLHDLKAQLGGDIHLAGGARLAQSVIRLGLVDEYHLFVHPVVSPGSQWFDDIDGNRNLGLISATTYDCGVTGLCYTPTGTARASRPDTFSEILAQ